MIKRFYVIALFTSIMLVSCTGTSTNGTGAGTGGTGGTGAGESATTCASNALCAALNGNVFYVTQKWDSPSSLDYLRDNNGTIQLRKDAFYFENTSSGLKYIELVKKHDILGYTAISGTATISSTATTTKAANPSFTLTLTQDHFCSRNENIQDVQKGDTIETILTTYAMCDAASDSKTYTVSVTTNPDGTTIVQDAAGEITLVEAIPKTPSGVTFTAPLGVYKPPTQIKGNDWFYLYLYADASGTLKYALVAENSASSSPKYSYAWSLGKIILDAAAGTITIGIPEKIYENCLLDMTLIAGESPFFPPYIRWDSTCTQKNTSSIFNTSDLALFCDNAGKTLKYTYNAGVLTLNDGVNDYVFTKVLQGGNYPGTTGAGAHYIWNVVPSAMIK